MKQIICILALLLMSVTTTKAQTSPATPSIRGKILTEEKQPIEFANIALLSEDSTFIQGTCSRSDGSFELLPPAPGNYLLQVSSIGYKTLCQPCPTGSTHNWILQTDAVLLAETVITAARPVFRLKGGKLETSVRQTLLASLNDANDVLKHIPGLRSSDEGYTVFGKGTPVIYIDNRLLQDNSELQRLSAADIEKVELITNPGAEYDATVKAVVRIRTVRNKRDCFGGNFRAGITQRRRSNHYGQVDLNYQKKGLSLLGSKYSINSLVYWVTYVHNVVYSFYRSMIYCYINSTQRCAGSIVIDIIPTNGADKRKFFPFAPYFPVTNVIKRYFYPYFPAIIGIKGYSFPYFPYLSGIMKIKTALYSLFSRLDWHKTVVFPCLGEIYEGIRSLSWEIPVT